MIMLNKNRISFYDNLKFILILLVVVGHVAWCQLDVGYVNAIYLFIYLFHMPLFIFITGLFAKKMEDENGRFRLNKVINYFVLYLIFKISIFVFNRFILHQEINLYLFTEFEAPWYILACAIWLSTTYLVKNVKPKFMLIFSIILALIIGYDINVQNTFALSRVIAFYPFYLLGYYLSKDTLTKFINKIHNRKFQVASAIILIICFGLMVLFENNFTVFKPFLTASYPYNFKLPLNLNLLFYPFLRLLFMIIAVGLSILVMSLVPRRSTFFTKFGSRTLQVYILHMFFIYFVFYTRIASYLSDLFGNLWPILSLIGGVVLTFILSIKLLEKPFNFISKQRYNNIFNEKVTK